MTVVPTRICQPRGLTQEGFLRECKAGIFGLTVLGDTTKTLLGSAGSMKLSQGVGSSHVTYHPERQILEEKKSAQRNVFKITGLRDGKIIDKSHCVM